MEKRNCGTNGLTLSALGLGCWAFGGGDYWGPVSQEQVDRLVHRALDLGITYFDTAEVYNAGRSEEALGHALKSIPRDRVVIGTKVAPSNAGPDTIKDHCEASLRRLDTDYIDLYMVHWPLNAEALRYFTDDEVLISNPPRVADVFSALDQLRQEGKVRHVGVSNFGAKQLQEVLQEGSIAANQLHYNMLSRAIEWEVLPLCREEGIGVIGYMALLQGILTGAYPTLDDVPPMQARTRHFHHTRSEASRHGEEGAEGAMRAALEGVRSVAEQTGRPLADLAVQWVLDRPGVSSTLVGTTNVDHLEANARAAETPLPPDAAERLDEVTHPLKEALGTNIDYWEGDANSRSR